MVITHSIYNNNIMILYIAVQLNPIHGHPYLYNVHCRQANIMKET